MKFASNLSLKSLILDTVKYIWPMSVLNVILFLVLYFTRVSAFLAVAIVRVAHVSSIFVSHMLPIVTKPCS